MDMLDPDIFKKLLKQYRRVVPSVGTVSSATVDHLFAESRICRGWITENGRKEYFHIIKSPGRYPEKSVMYADDEQALLAASCLFALQHGIDFEKLITD